MIVTYNWLKEYVDFDLDPEELSHGLTMAGLEVDAMEKMGEGLDSVVVARLASVEAHPEADRLTLCQVQTGSETVQVVCGATNHKSGDLVALAQVGTVLPGNFKIKKSKIRGQVSMGMLCSEKELGLAEESPGILILPGDLEPGRPVFDALGLKDVRYEIGLTPNRPDCLSVLGVAREVAAMVGQPLRLPEATVTEGGPAIEELTSVTLDAPGLCPRYAARLIQGVRIGPSPEWLVRRLESVGLRSINNVVDVTNFILMELGQPLHAFDFHELRGRRIVVQRSREESFTTLDSQSRDLISSDLVICDGEGPVALAGIMGGENSEVQEETTDILLESAYFAPLGIRRTAKRLGIHSESSHRFERGTDVDMVPFALDRAAGLIREVAGGTVATGRIDAYPSAVAKKRLTLTPRRTNEILGLQLATVDIESLLRSIGLTVEIAADREDEALYVTVPSFRPDLEREIDLIEEVARLNGYQRVPTTMPAGRSICHRLGRSQQLSRQVRNAMVEAGFAEVINYSFVAESSLDRILLTREDSRRRGVQILNPLTEEQAVMRTTLVPSLLETVARNLAYRSRDLSLFELRPVYLPQEGKELPQEQPRMAAVICGRREPEGWAQDKATVDFYDLKGVVEGLLDNLRIVGLRWDADRGENFYHPGKSCAILHDGELLGTMGEIHPRVLGNYDIDLPVYLVDLDLRQVERSSGGFDGFRPLSRFPDVHRDSAFLLDEVITAQEVFEVLDQVKARHVESTTLFDLYRGKGVPEGKKSLAVRVRYRSPEKTLTDEEITAAHKKIVQALEKRLGAEIR